MQRRQQRAHTTDACLNPRARGWCQGIGEQLCDSRNFLVGFLADRMRARGERRGPRVRDLSLSYPKAVGVAALWDLVRTRSWFAMCFDLAVRYLSDNVIRR